VPGRRGISNVPALHHASAVACDSGHPHHEAGRRDTRIRDPLHGDPTNYESRTDWQRALWKSKIPGDAKRFIKQLENHAIDGWEESFEKVWERIEGTLDRGLPITDDVFIEYLTDSAQKQLRGVGGADWDSAFNGLYLQGKEHADLSNGKRSSMHTAQIIDTLEEQAMLARLRATSLAKVRSITNTDLKDAILEALSKPGAAAKNPTALANEIIRQERKRLEEAVTDRAELKAEIKKLYDSAAWKVQRITRTESSNAYTLSVLLCYQSQGIVKVRWNSHSEQQSTCTLCLALDGTEHNIEDLLKEGGRYPLSTQSHIQCRCWFSPCVSHITLADMERMYEDRPDLFAPGQTVFDQAQLDLEDVVKEYRKVHGIEMRDVPVEYEQEIKETSGILAATPYQQHQPVELRFVQDVGATPEFKKSVPLPGPVLGQVTAWTSPDNQLLVSKFSADDGNTISAALIRAWAANVYDSEASIRRASEKFYERDEVRPADISPRTIDKLLSVFDPYTLMRRQQIGEVASVALEKRLREASDEELSALLNSLDIRKQDEDTLLTWRMDRPVWTLDGTYVPPEGTTGSDRNRFVNRSAEVGSREMMIESVVAFVGDPHSLLQRDPELYSYLRENVFDGKEFKE
jgi:hypothetical protein